MIEFRVLGSLDLRGPEGETLLSVLAQPKRVALLAYLAVATPHGYHRRDKLLGLFWPERDQEHGRSALRKALYFLRQSLGEEMLVSRGDEEVGLAEGEVWCDAVAFEEALEAGDPEKALELYRGDLLEGFFISEAPEFERWLEGERERLRTRAAEAAWALAAREEAAGNGFEAGRWGRTAVGYTPEDEGAFRRLLELLDRMGDRAGALREYEAFARRLKEEYDGEPSPETQALIAAIREREVAAAGESSEQPLVAQAGGARAVAPGPVALAPAREREAEPRPISLLRVLATYAVVSLAVLVAVHIFTLQLGLPDWFFRSAVVVLLVCLPIIVATALVQGEPARAAALAGETAALTPTRKLPPVARRWLTWRNAIGVVVVAFALLGVAVSGYMAMRVMGIGPVGTLVAKGVLEPRERIVLADFEDHTPNSALGLVVTEAFRIDLERSPVIRIAEREYLADVLQRMERDLAVPLDYDAAREVAIREGLGAVIAGRISSVGTSYVVSVRLVAAEDGEVLFADREAAADPGAIIDAIDRLSKRLRERIGESLTRIRRSEPLKAVTTSSLPALTKYSEGVHALYSEHDVDIGIALIEEAIALDSTFAMAHSTLGIWLPAGARRVAALRRAFELRERLTEGERYFVTGYFHFYVTGEYDEAATAFRRTVDVNPEHGRALNFLGLIYRTLRDWERSEEFYRRAVEGSPWNAIVYVTLFNAQVRLGRLDEAEATARLLAERFPDHPHVERRYADLAYLRGDYEAAEQHLQRVGARPSRGNLATVQGKLSLAEGYYRDILEVQERRGRYANVAPRLGWGEVLVEGSYARSLNEIEAALERYPLEEMDPLDRPYLTIGRYYALAGKPEQARALLSEDDAVELELRRSLGLSAAPPRQPGRHRLLGLIALAEGRPRDAIQEFRAWDEDTYCVICPLPDLARAYERAGEPDSAIALYERYVETPWPALDLRLRYDALNLAPSCERLGQLYEQRGDTAKATYYYGKLVELWKDADPELQPRVEAARRAIEALSPDT